MTDRQWLMKSQISPSHFNYAGEEIKDRIKVSKAIGDFIEDIADIENAIGKSLLKAGSQNSLANKPELMHCGGSSFATWESIQKSVTAQLGKQQSSLHVHLTQNIVKAFPDSLKEFKKTVKSLEQTISSSCDEYRKLKSSYKKQWDKYIRLAYDTESLIKSKALMLSGGDIQSDKDDNFMNLSLNKILGKAPTNDKKLVDKCREMIKELEINENNVGLVYQKVYDAHRQLESDIHNSLVEINNVEINRYLLMKESLTRLFVAEDLVVECLNETIIGLKSQIEIIKSKPSLPDLISLRNGLPADIALIREDSFLSLYTKATDKVVETVDSLKYLIFSVRQYCADIGDAGKLYLKSVQKILEKHGFSKNATPSTTHVRNPSVQTHVFTANFADLLANESPTMRIVWESVVRSFGGFAEMHFKVAEMLSEKVCGPMDAALRNLEDIRRDLLEKISFHTKRITNGHANLSKISQKLQKAQKDIQERKSALSKAKEEEAHNSNLNAPENRAPSPSSDLSSKPSLGTLRSSSLSVVVGLESFADRVNRLEAKISSLEDEEALLKESFDNSNAGMSIIYNSMKSEMFTCLVESVDNIVKESDNLLSIADSFLDVELSGLHLRKASISDAKASFENIDLDQDLKYVVKQIQTSGKAQEDENKDSLYLDITMVEEFTPFSSDILASERRLLRELASREVASSQEKNIVIGTNSHDEGDDEQDVEISSTYSDFSDFQADSPIALMPSRNNGKLDILSPIHRTEKPKPFQGLDPTRIGPHETEKRDLVQHKAATNENFKDTNSSNLRTPSKATSPTNDFQSPTTNPVQVNTHTKDTSEINELLKFGLSHNDKVLESFSCAVYPKKGMLTHGRMYITQHFLAFSGWPDTRILLAMSDIKNIDKTNTLIYVPNALSIKSSDNEEYFFASFLDRDQCYNLLFTLSEVARRLENLHGPNADVKSRGLVFGFQSNFSALAGNSIMNAIASASSNFGADASIKNMSVLSDGQVKQSDFESMTASAIASLKPYGDAINRIVADSTSEVMSSEKKQIKESSSDASESIVNTPSKTLELRTEKSDKIQSSNKSRQPVQPVSPSKKSSKTIIPSLDLALLFSRSGVTPLAEYTFQDISSEHYWRLFWAKADGFADFLYYLGDLDIVTSEWKPITKSTIVEDITKLSFKYSRSVEYLHPRTTFLMFGPKNAPGKQLQYLYIPQEDCDINSCSPSQGVIMTVTQLDGIPMGDTFRVVQYWTFEMSPTNPTSLIVRVGMAMHMLKATMFKSNISTGTKEELDEQVKKFHIYLQTLFRDYPDNGTVDGKDGGLLRIISPRAETSPQRQSPGPPSALRRRSKLYDDGLAPSIEPGTLESPVVPKNEWLLNKVLWALVLSLVFIVIVQWRTNSSLRSQISEVSRKVLNLEANLADHVKAQKQQISQLMAEVKKARNS